MARSNPNVVKYTVVSVKNTKNFAQSFIYDNQTQVISPFQRQQLIKEKIKMDSLPNGVVVIGG